MDIVQMCSFSILVCIFKFGLSFSQGLYSTTDEVTVMSAENFTQIFDDPRINWLIEFYNSHCGECQTYAPYFKVFSKSIKNWHWAINVGVVDCAPQTNWEFCRKSGVQAVPQMELYSQHMTPGPKGVFGKSHREVEKMQLQLIQFLVIEVKFQLLLPIENFANHPAGHHALLIDDATGTTARKAILNFQHRLKDSLLLYWRQAVRDVNTTALYLVSSGSAKLLQDNLTGEQLDKLLSTFLLNAARFTASIPTGPTFAKVPVHIRREGSVHLNDMLASLTILLQGDVGMHREISGENLAALRIFIQVVIKYFDGPPQLTASLQRLERKLSELVSRGGAISGGRFKTILDSAEFPRYPISFTECKGSLSYTRRYPCGLWTLFHALTVRQYLTEPEATADQSRQVVASLAMFIPKFFSCRYCAQNFAKEVVNYTNEIDSTRDAVLYFWRLHNRVNARLAKEPLVDPQYPKRQYPTDKECPSCHGPAKDDSVLPAVFDFLVSRYKPESWVKRQPTAEGVAHRVARRSLPNAYSTGESGSADGIQLTLETSNWLSMASRNTLGFSLIDLSLCMLVSFVSSFLAIVLFWGVCRRRLRCRHKNGAPTPLV